MLDEQELNWRLTWFQPQAELFLQGPLPKRKRIFMHFDNRGRLCSGMALRSFQKASCTQSIASCRLTKLTGAGVDS
jgi:hypothetical protein